jgi:hypothetical protein
MLYNTCVSPCTSGYVQTYNPATTYSITKLNLFVNNSTLELINSVTNNIIGATLGKGMYISNTTQRLTGKSVFYSEISVDTSVKNSTCYLKVELSDPTYNPAIILKFGTNNSLGIYLESGIIRIVVAMYNIFCDTGGNNSSNLSISNISNYLVACCVFYKLSDQVVIYYKTNGTPGSYNSVNSSGTSSSSSGVSNINVKLNTGNGKLYKLILLDSIAHDSQKIVTNLQTLWNDTSTTMLSPSALTTPTATNWITSWI